MNLVFVAYWRAYKMNTNRLVISSKKYKGDTSVFSVRLPAEMVKELDNISEITGRNRNEIISICLEFAIQNMVVNEEHTD